MTVFWYPSIWYFYLSFFSKFAWISQFFVLKISGMITYQCIGLMINMYYIGLTWHVVIETLSRDTWQCFKNVLASNLGKIQYVLKPCANSRYFYNPSDILCSLSAFMFHIILLLCARAFTQVSIKSYRRTIPWVYYDLNSASCHGHGGLSSDISG